jgi:hypothetical protein
VSESTARSSLAGSHIFALPIAIILSHKMASSVLNAWARSDQTASDARRHTTDHTARSTSNTPAASRSSSVASNRSEPSAPSWYSAYNGTDTTKARSNSTASQPSLSPRNPKGKLKEKPGTTATSGWKALFGGGEDRKESKKKEKDDIDRIVLTSRHAAAVKTRLALDPKFKEERRRSSAGSPDVGAHITTGIQTNAHTTAAEQEFRFPHSGKPSLHKGARGEYTRKGRSGEHVEIDMPALTRIVSGDDHDEEDERAQRGREEWIMKKNDAAMRRFIMAEGMEPGEDDESRDSTSLSENTSPGEELADGKVMKVQGTKVIGVELEGDAYTPRVKPKGGIGYGWKRDEKGNWTRPE